MSYTPLPTRMKTASTTLSPVWSTGGAASSGAIVSFRKQVQMSIANADWRSKWQALSAHQPMPNCRKYSTWTALRPPMPTIFNDLEPESSLLPAMPLAGRTREMLVVARAALELRLSSSGAIIDCAKQEEQKVSRRHDHLLSCPRPHPVCGQRIGADQVALAGRPRVRRHLRRLIRSKDLAEFFFPPKAREASGGGRAFAANGEMGVEDA